MHDGKKAVIGVGGCIGSGKTTVSKIFEKLGAHYISADECGWEVLDEIRGELVEKFSDDIIENNTVNRQKLRALVFSSRKNLEYLNRISHPRLVRKLVEKINRITSGVVVLDAALLFDWPEVYEKIDFPVLVRADVRKREVHAAQKGISRVIFRRICAFQKSEDKAEKLAWRTIDNRGSIEDLKVKCRRIFEEVRDDC